MQTEIAYPTGYTPLVPRVLPNGWVPHLLTVDTLWQPIPDLLSGMLVNQSYSPIAFAYTCRMRDCVSPDLRTAERVYSKQITGIEKSLKGYVK